MNNKIDEEDFLFDENKVIENLKDYSSEKLSEIVVNYRYLGLYEKVSVAAMKELAVRRDKGDIFNYEEYIENSLKTLPLLDHKLITNGNGLNDLLNLVKNLKGFIK